MAVTTRTGAVLESGCLLPSHNEVLVGEERTAGEGTASVPQNLMVGFSCGTNSYSEICLSRELIIVAHAFTDSVESSSTDKMWGRAYSVEDSWHSGIYTVLCPCESTDDSNLKLLCYWAIALLC
jgi:hypothetical protein